MFSNTFNFDILGLGMEQPTKPTAVHTNPPPKPPTPATAQAPRHNGRLFKSKSDGATPTSPSLSRRLAGPYGATTKTPGLRGCFARGGKVSGGNKFSKLKRGTVSDGATPRRPQERHSVAHAASFLKELALELALELPAIPSFAPATQQQLPAFPSLDELTVDMATITSEPVSLPLFDEAFPSLPDLDDDDDDAAMSNAFEFEQGSLESTFSNLTCNMPPGFFTADTAPQQLALPMPMPMPMPMPLTCVPVTAQAQAAAPRIVDADKPHGCSLCTKAFVSFSKLERHVRTHTGEKPFKCSCCSDAFAQKAGLKIHSMKHAKSMAAQPQGTWSSTQLINGFQVQALLTSASPRPPPTKPNLPRPHGFQYNK